MTSYIHLKETPKAPLMLIVLLSCTFLVSTCTKRNKKPATPIVTGNGEIRAVSLNALQQKLKACLPNNACPPELLQFAGIKKMMGVIADEQNHDFVLFGQTDDNLPPLQLEDFVVALRNAWLKYASLKGDVYVYSNPGCSIDPNPEVMRQLERASDFKISPSGDASQSISNWNQVCERPQAVRVLGIPFNTHFAQVMIKADYDMKRLVDGSDALDLPGLVSLMDMRIEEAKNESSQPLNAFTSGASLNRFWFYPGENVYEENEGIILIRKCPIKLLTEQMYSNGKNRTDGSGNVDPLANEFANGLTILYEKVARTRSIYAELSGLFRLTALAKIMKSRYAELGVDLSYLLDTYPVETTPIQKELPGRPSVREFQDSQEIRGGTRHIYRWFQSCGGVDIGIEADSAIFRKSANERLLGFKQEVLGSRLAPDSAYWVLLEGSAETRSALAYNSRIYELNQVNEESRLFTVVSSVEGRSFRYELYDGERTEQFANIGDLVGRVNDRLADDLRKFIYFDVEGISSEKDLEAFAASCRLQQAARNQEVEIVTLSRAKAPTEVQDAFLSPGIRLDKSASRVEAVTEGARKGRFKVVLNFLTNIGNAVRRVIVNVYFKTIDQAQAFVDAVHLESGTQKFRLSSPADVINQVLKKVKREDLQELGDFYIAKVGAPAAMETT